MYPGSNKLLIQHMRLSSRYPSYFLVASYVLLSAASFSSYIVHGTLKNPTHVVGTEIVAWLALWCIFKRPAYFHWLLLPAFLALPLELYLAVYYKQGISPHHLGIIFETSPAEALEFLGQRVWWAGSIYAAVLAWWVCVGWVAVKTRSLDWNDASRWVCLALLTCAGGLWCYDHRLTTADTALPASTAASSSLGEAQATADTGKAGHAGTGLSPAKRTSTKDVEFPGLPSWAKVPFDPEAFAKTWPFGLMARGYDFWKERRYLTELSHRSLSFQFRAQQPGGSETPQVVIMVIGESSRFDRWSLNGYERETNPLLKAEANVISLKDVVTAVSATRLSVPVLISRKPARESLQAGFSEKSFLSAFKEAGFKTWWISNQMAFGKFDTPVSVFAKEADITQFLNLGGFSGYSSFDEELMKPLKAALEDASQKKLIVLHTLGSHWNYSQRYPKTFDKWQPSLYGVANPAYTDSSMKGHINNSYDNSILYTDWFLAQVISQLKKPGLNASMLYVADHGQALYDGTCKLAFHGHNTKHEFHVPSVVWYSETYHAANPEKIKYLHRHQDAKLSTENVFHSLLDMAGIRYPDERLEWSFLSPMFQTHKRYVDSYGWSNYDNATFKGDCKEVIDKGKPLIQIR
jgi:glucan phosphoethanolaminetransferase (alkaline phosphatase superfamily)